MRKKSEQNYPFSEKIRFAQIVAARFLFLRDTKLHIYSENGKEVISGITSDRLSETLLNEFNFNLIDFLNKYKR